MDKKELKKYLLEKNVPEIIYSLEGGLPSEKYCIEENNEIWHVYYSERGIKQSIGYFDDEESACNRLLLEIQNETGIDF